MTSSGTSSGAGSGAGARVAVTGSTGQVGGRVARGLAAAGVEQRLLVRDASRAPDLPGATVHVAPYADGDAARRALEGVDLLFMVSGSESADRVEQHRTFVEAAAAAGVGHVVYTSFQGASPTATFTLARDHHATEQVLRGSGAAWTFLRDSFYADVLPHFVGDDGVLRGPAGDGRVAAVAQDDVAAAALAVLRDPAAHAGATHDLTGPESLTLEEVAETITRVTGRAVTYRDETLEEARASRAAYGAPDWQLEAWVSTYTAIAAGEVARTSTAVADLTGRPATSLAQLLAR